MVRLAHVLAATTLFAAPVALAQEANPPLTPNESTSTESSPPPAPRPRRSTHHRLPVPDLHQSGFGSQGTFVLSNDASGDMGYLNVEGLSGFRLNLSPAGDYFVQDHFSMGAALSFRVLSYNSSTDVMFGVEPRVGYQFPVSPAVSIWPKLGLEIDTSSPERFVGIAADTSGGVVFGADIDIPVLYTATDHFFVGGGLSVHTEFTGDYKSNFVGLVFEMGGWF